MVNLGLNPASILGIFIAIAGAALYFLRSVRPELSRDHDIFFAAVGLLCGFILLFQGWRLDPILQFGQLLLTGSTIFFAVESIRLRSVATEQAKRNTRIVDDDRRVSDVYEYRADLEEIEPEYEDRPVRKQIPGTRDNRRTRSDEYEDEAPRDRRDEYDDEGRRRSSNRSTNAERLGQGDKPRRRRPRPDSRVVERPEDDAWDSPKRADDEWDTPATEARKPPRRSTNGSSRPRDTDVASKPRKRRPPEDGSRRRQPNEEATPSEYVDYKPIERSDDEPDNSTQFDEV